MAANSKLVSPGASAHLVPDSGPDGPVEVPVLPLQDVLVFPLMIAPIVITEEHSRRVAEEAMKGDRMIAVFHPGEEVEVLPSDPADVSPDQLYRVGTLCTVLRILRVPDGSIRLLLHGVARVRIAEVTAREPILRARVEPIVEFDDYKGDIEVDALVKVLLDSLQRAIGMSAMPDELAVAAINVEGPARLADLVASNLPVRPRDLLPVLGEADAKRRIHLVQHLLGREILMLEIGHRINNEVREEVDKNQRSFYLQQQLRAIRRELGEMDPHEAELEELQSRIEKGNLPAHAREIATRELKRLQALPTAAAEYGVIRTYLDWILDIPWGTVTNDHVDIHAARAVLDEDHYGLETVKDRILEFLSVIRLKNGDLRGPILCFVGPPGVGKTSLGRSIARAVGRKFINFSLGGMRDEAEIRGHRRTYVGAMPGRIVKALKESGTMNPLIMLDEVDKLGSDFRGDPASALLEVLDPEQNFHFNDHYMDMAVDLSKVMFITTANTLDSIPPPLRDRMEIIRIAGYTEFEKCEIAMRYLVPRELEASGLSKRDLVFNKATIRALIQGYTAEAGVRNLQREIGKICRKTARAVAEHDSAVEAAAAPPPTKKGRRRPAPPPPVPERPARRILTPADLEHYLGPRRTFSEVAERLDRPGVAVGLAWTSIGGEILFIESARYPGKGALKLTGQLGDVMKESAEAAMTYLRTHHGELGIGDVDFEKYDYHVHVPAGATPKDGPSAGVAMATSLASLMTGRRVKNFVAMTGEITLRGNVMPVGGIKEKVLAAHRSGIREVFLPHHNQGDYTEVPEPVRKGLKVSFLREVNEYIRAAIT